MKKQLINLLCIAGIAFGSASCDFLDVVPDNVATIENAFANELEARKYLATIYSYLPHHDKFNNNIALMGSDEITSWHILTLDNQITPIRLVTGDQNRNSPILSYWSGDNNGRNYHEAIHDCNVFIENVSDESKIYDLTPSDRRRWLGEAYFLKAYYTFYMMRMYGPVILMRENLPVDAPTEIVRQKRVPFDECVEYVSELLDMAAERLPDKIINTADELGRPTRPAALALKARVLVTAASPLFNGNPDYANFVDHDGVHLMSTERSQEKWEAAAAACDSAVVACHKAGIELYEFTDSENISDVTRRKLSINNAATLRWNKELIWGLSSRNDEGLQADCMARLDPNDPTNIWGGRDLGNPTVEIGNLYYTRNGIPIDEDKTWHYNTRDELRTATTEELRPDQRLYDLGRAFRPRTPLLRTPRLRRFDLVAEERSERFGREHMDRKGPRRRRTVASGRLQLFGDGLLVQKTRQLQVQAHHGRQRLHGGTLSVARTPACRPLPALRRSAQRMRQGRGRHLLARQSPRTRRPEGRERVVGHLRHHEEIRHPDRAARNHPPRENPRNDVRRIALLGPAPLEGGRKTT